MFSFDVGLPTGALFDDPLGEGGVGLARQGFVAFGAELTALGGKIPHARIIGAVGVMACHAINLTVRAIGMGHAPHGVALATDGQHDMFAIHLVGVAGRAGLNNRELEASGVVRGVRIMTDSGAAELKGGMGCIPCCQLVAMAHCAGPLHIESKQWIDLGAMGGMTERALPGRDRLMDDLAPHGVVPMTVEAQDFTLGDPELGFGWCPVGVVASGAAIARHRPVRRSRKIGLVAVAGEADPRAQRD